MLRAVRALRLITVSAVAALTAFCVATITFRAFGRVTLVVALILVPVGLMFVANLRQNRQHRRLTRGLCVRCGYDLTGNVSGVCPECGRCI